MPYADSSNVRIHYQTEGSGPPLLIHPGFVASGEEWAEVGYLAPLQAHYRVIVLEPRGQGRSDHPHDPAAYTRERRVADVLAVLDAELIDRAHFWGYSMGAAMGFECGVAAPARFRSLVLGGNHPFDGEPGALEDDSFLTWLEAGMAAVVNGIAQIAPDYWASASARERWLASDAQALTAARRQRLTEPDLGEGAVAAIPVPALLYAGARDEPEPIARTAYLMQQATFLGLPGSNHLQAFIRSEAILPYALAFLAGV